MLPENECDCWVCELPLDDDAVADEFLDLWEEAFTFEEEGQLELLILNWGVPAYRELDYRQMENDYDPNAPIVNPERTGRQEFTGRAALNWINELPGEPFHWFGPPTKDEDTND